ncbi:MAG: AraC family transcriptional regulator [Deltaproteobacteria bacterium]|nr:MAG: AraC family transcriptional regulator [Deltaproteobacteria bacterium]
MSDSRDAEARLFLLDGRVLYLGSIGINTDLHAHHAVQLAIALLGRMRLRTDPTKDWAVCEAAVVASNQRHQLEADCEVLALFYFDPQSVEAARLIGPPSSRMQRGLTIVEPPQDAIWRSMLLDCLSGPPDAQKAVRAWRAVLDDLGAEPHATEQLDPRVTQALEILAELSDPRISTADLASRVGLSPSRFSHVFREHVGLPLRRYLVWRRLQDAVLLLAEQRTLTEVAHAAGFADSAHFSRAFRRMFGVPPSSVVKYSRIVQARGVRIW